MQLVSGREDSINYLPQTVVDVQDLVSYSGNDKIVVKDLIYDVPDNEAIEVSYNKKYEQLDTFYSSSIPDGTYEKIIQKGLISSSDDIKDISDGLFSGSYDDNGFVNYDYAEESVSNWTIQKTDANTQWQGICWAAECDNGLGGKGLFVAVGFNGGPLAITSPDGINWTSRSTPGGGNAWNSVAWSAKLNLFAAVSTSGTGRIMISSNGIDWELIQAPQQLSWRTIIWSAECDNGFGGKGLFVAVSQSGNGYGIMTSHNGVDWKIQITGIKIFNCNATSGSNIINCDNTEGLTVGMRVNNFLGDSILNNSVVVSITSIDNINNTFEISSNAVATGTATLLADSGWYSIAWSPQLNLFVAVADSQGTGNRIMTSPDTINWTRKNSLQDVRWFSICWSPELSLFVAVAAPNPPDPLITQRVITSSNGDEWTLRDTPGNIGWNGVCWSPELSLFVAIGGDNESINNAIMTSYDGIHWKLRYTPITIGVSNTEWRNITWSSELGIFVGVSRDKRIDGIMISEPINKPNIVGTAYSGKQWMSAREVIKPSLYFYNHNKINNINNINNIDNNHSGFFRYYDNSWKQVPIMNQTIPYADAPYYFNTDIKYLRHNWYGLRGYTKIQQINDETPTFNINSSTKVCDIVFYTDFDNNIKTFVSDAMKEIQILHSSKKDAEYLEYHKLEDIIDSIPTICKLTNTRITLPAFLCPDNNIDWKIKYRVIDYEEPQPGPEPEPCLPCQFVGGPCGLTQRNNISTDVRSFNTLFNPTPRVMKPKKRDIKKNDIKGFSLEKYKTQSSPSLPPTRSSTIKCGCASKGNINL